MPISGSAEVVLAFSAREEVAYASDGFRSSEGVDGPDIDAPEVGFKSLDFVRESFEEAILIGLRSGGQEKEPGTPFFQDALCLFAYMA